MSNKPEQPKVREKRPEKKAWSEKIEGKEKRGEQREKRKTIKDKLRRAREEEAERERRDHDAEVEEDWKDIRRERKRAKLGKSKQRETNDGAQFDL
jgi:hypothetical protein